MWCRKYPLRINLIKALKREELEQSASDRGQGSTSELMYFSSIKVCKPILIVNQHKITNLKRNNNLSIMLTVIILKALIRGNNMKE